MKNPFGVKPTRFMKRKAFPYAIDCIPTGGPSFGHGDLEIADFCNIKTCFVINDGTNGYECHPKLHSSLFVNSDLPWEENTFIVSDYEVYSCK